MRRLGELMDTHQSSGKLDPVLAIKSETERFSKARELGQGDLVEKPVGLVGAQKKYLVALDTLRATLKEKKVAAADAYISRLDALKVELTKAGKIEEASSVAAELESARKARPWIGQAPPDEAVEWQGHHYAVISHPKVSFADAKVGAEKLGGHLAYLGTDAERKFVQQLRKGGGTAWVGVSDQDEES